MTGDMTFEFWLKEEELNEALILALFTVENNASIHLSREVDKIQC